MLYVIFICPKTYPKTLVSSPPRPHTHSPLINFETVGQEICRISIVQKKQGRKQSKQSNICVSFHHSQLYM